MNLEEAVNSIRDDKHYYDKSNPVGRLPSNSSIGKLLSDNPKSYLDPFPNHINLTKGSYYHDLVTRPEEAEKYVIIPNDLHRGSGEYKELENNTNSGVLMKQSEADEMRFLADKTLEHPFINQILNDPSTLIEEPYIVKKHDVWWKMKQDIVVPSMKLCVDLKTSNAEDFGDSCYHWGYNSQCSMYLSPHDEEWDFLFFVANKKSTKLTIYRPSDKMLESGEKRIEQAAEVYKKWKWYYESNLI